MKNQNLIAFLFKNGTLVSKNHENLCTMKAIAVNFPTSHKKRHNFAWEINLQK